MGEYLVYNRYIGMTIEEFVENNKKLVFSIANGYRKLSMNSVDDLDDYIQIGFEGLIKSYHKFNPEKVQGPKAKPSTFATLFIKRELSNFLRDKYSLVKYPRDFTRVWNRVRKLGLEDEKDYHKISNEIDMKVDIVKEAMSYIDKESPLSLYSPADKNSNQEDLTLIDTIFKMGDYSIVVVNDFIDRLDDLTKEVLFFKLIGNTFEEIAEATGIEVSAVNNEVRKVRRRLKQYYQEV